MVNLPLYEIKVLYLMGRNFQNEISPCFYSYRTRDEIQEVRQSRDPITGFKQKLIDSGLVSAEEIKVRKMLLAQRLKKMTRKYLAGPVIKWGKSFPSRQQFKTT